MRRTGAAEEQDGAPCQPQMQRTYGLCGVPRLLDVITASILTACLHPTCGDPLRLLSSLLNIAEEDSVAVVGAITEAGCSPQDIICAYLHNVRVLHEDKASASTPAAHNLPSVAAHASSLLSEIALATAAAPGCKPSNTSLQRHGSDASGLVMVNCGGSEDLNVDLTNSHDAMSEISSMCEADTSDVTLNSSSTQSSASSTTAHLVVVRALSDVELEERELLMACSGPMAVENCPAKVPGYEHLSSPAAAVKVQPPPPPPTSQSAASSMAVAPPPPPPPPRAPQPMLARAPITAHIPAGVSKPVVGASPSHSAAPRSNPQSAGKVTSPHPTTQQCQQQQQQPGRGQLGAHTPALQRNGNGSGNHSNAVQQAQAQVQQQQQAQLRTMGSVSSFSLSTLHGSAAPLTRTSSQTMDGAAVSAAHQQALLAASMIPSPPSAGARRVVNVRGGERALGVSAPTPSNPHSLTHAQPHAQQQQQQQQRHQQAQAMLTNAAAKAGMLQHQQQQQEQWSSSIDINSAPATWQYYDQHVGNGGTITISSDSSMRYLELLGEAAAAQSGSSHTQSLASGVYGSSPTNGSFLMSYPGHVSAPMEQLRHSHHAFNSYLEGAGGMGGGGDVPAYYSLPYSSGLSLPMTPVASQQQHQHQQRANAVAAAAAVAAAQQNLQQMSYAASLQELESLNLAQFM